MQLCCIISENFQFVLAPLNIHHKVSIPMLVAYVYRRHSIPTLIIKRVLLLQRLITAYYCREKL